SFFFSSRRRHTRSRRDWSSDVCSSDLAAALARITRAILNDENAVLPLSVHMDGEYGLNDLYIGSPAVVNSKGVKQIIEVPLNDSEKDRMKASADQLKNILDQAFAQFDA